MYESLNKWLIKDFSIKLDKSLEKKLNEEYCNSLNNSQIKDKNFTDNTSYFYKCLNIIHEFSKRPWTIQIDIFNKLKINKEELIVLNSIIRNSDFFQDIILKKGTGNKYWNTIIPFSKTTDKVLENIYSFPQRIAIFPGVSCMFYCGFCGRNQSAKYPLSIIEDSIKTYKKLFSVKNNNTAFSISGGLEPLTHPKLGEIISDAHEKNIKIPLITNGYSLTENYIKKNPGIWKLDSLRISLYGVDAESYHFITRVKKSFEIVKKNTINFLKQRNINNPNLKFGFNFIIIPENMNQLDGILDLVKEINEKVDNGNGVDFITLRDDYQSVTGGNKKNDADRKYRLHSKMSDVSRTKLIRVINKFKKKKTQICPNVHIDFGYSIESLSKGIFDKQLIRVSGNEMRKLGFTQLSVAVDLYGDVFLFREAGFLNRAGNSKMIIGRISSKKTLEDVIKEFLNKKIPLNLDNDDSRFMDSFDHVLTVLVNQAEKDKNFGIPFSFGPVRDRFIARKMKIGNNWYSDSI